VVVASSNRAALLLRCVDALSGGPEGTPRRGQTVPLEILVVRDPARPDLDWAGARRRFPQVRWIEAPPDSTVPRLRGIGIEAATASLIALIEDDCLVHGDWSSAAIAAHGHDRLAAVGGAVEPGPYRRGLDWAVYFCEYGRFMLPLRNAGALPPPGNNVVYRADSLRALPAEVRRELQEVFVDAAWRRQDVRTGVSETLVVVNVNSWTARHLLAVPYHHGRAYAGARFGGRTRVSRWLVALLALSLPIVKTARIIVSVVSRGRRRRRLLHALPWIVLFNISWSTGEVMGCVLGPGSSPSRWR
jgi:hypothetical protein